MASDVKIRFRSFLPGGGFDSAGNPKQGKTRVVGEIDVTSYVGSSGEPLSAADVGLNAIDHADLKVREQVAGDFSGSAVTREVAYSHSAARFYLFSTDEDGARTAPLAETTESLTFVVEGDSAHDVELT
jgi:hypothetical protein